MKKELMIRKMPLLLLVSGLVVTAAIAQTSSGRGSGKNTDTLPSKEKKIRDLDEALLELDKGEAEMAKALKGVDFEKMEREIRASLKEIDVAKLKQEVARSLQGIDMTKMKEDLAKSLKEIDMQKLLAQTDKTLQQIDVEKMRTDVAKAMKEIDQQKIEANVQQALKEIDTEKLKAEIDKIKEVDVEKIKEEMRRIKPEVEKSMEKAKTDMAKARQELTSYKNLVAALDQDGLLNKKEVYKVEYKGGELTVNGKKLSADDAKKYSEFLSGKKDFTLKKEADDFSIQQ